MKRNSLFLACLLLLGGTRCFALDATFSKAHACVRPDEHISSFSCEINQGDTLSKDAAAVYGDWHLYPAIKDANPEIADANLIYAGKRIMIPDVPSGNMPAVTEPESATIALPTEATVANMVSLPTFPMASPATAAAPEVATAQAPAEQATPSDEAPNSAETGKVLVPKTSGYEFTVDDPNPHGPLETQLVLFNSEDEKRLGLPIQRIDLKPSLAVPAADGGTMVFVRLKKIPAQPFMLLVGGIKTPIDGAQVQAYSGKVPGTHAFARTLASIGRTSAQGAVSFAVGGPVLAACVVGIPQAIRAGIALNEKVRERKLAAKQAAADRSKLALYRASIESETLSKEIRQ